MKNFTLLLLLSFLSTPSFTGQTTNDCVAPMDLNTWHQEGDLNYGNWSVSSDGSSLTQSINGSPTFFVSPDDYINTTVEGEFGVQTSSDDDFVGFVLGYKSPNGSTANNNYEFILFDWKQLDQNYECFASSEMRLRRISGVPTTQTGAFWCSSDAITTVLATNNSMGGWQDYTYYSFKADYTETNIKIWIDNVLVFDVDGQFSSGKFGFYNYSQANSVYRNFAIPFKTFIEKTDSSCLNLAEGTAEAIPSTTELGPYTYQWSNGATTKVATDLVPGTYTVDVYGANGCHSSESVTIESPPDTTPPQAVTKDITIELDEFGNATITPDDIDNGSSDNCGIETKSLSQSNFTSSDLGANTVSLTVTDYDGNSHSETATVTVVKIDTSSFITTWKTDNPGSSCNSCITIPTTGTGYNYDVDWNDDGIFDETGITGNITHNFGAPGTYTIRIRGDFPSIYFNNSGDREKVLSVDQWGDISWQSMENAFYGCKNLSVLAQDAPDLSQVSSLYQMFFFAENFNNPIDHWEVHTITNMAGMFHIATSFNQPLNAWNVSNVSNMDNMFSGANSFNQPLNQWNTSSVNSMRQMFWFANSFNQNLENWDVSQASDMFGMFTNATQFNGSLANWDVGNVTNMDMMFSGANSFNQNIGNWDVGNVQFMQNLFAYATSFNQDIGSWNVSNVINMDSMLKNASSFDQDIGNWNVSNVIDMDDMFGGATSFNQGLNNWDVSSVTTMFGMFANATSFNQDIGDWNVSNVVEMTYMFLGSQLSTDNYDNLLLGWSSQSLKPNVNFHGGNSQYCEGAAARQHMINNDGWTITDAGPAGNLLTLDQETLPDINESCEVLSISAPTATDCSGQIITATTTTEFPITTQGETIVTWVYDDGIGNTVEQEQTVIIADLTPPIITCEPITKETDEGQCEASVVVPLPAVSDNCNLSSTALEFDGLNDYVEIQNFAFLPDFTIEAWVNPVYIANEGYRSIVSKGAVFDANTNYDFGIRRNYRNGNYFVYLYFQGGATINGIALEIDNTANTWTHLAGSFDSATKTLKLYQDGQLLGSAVSTVLPTDGGYNLRVGHPATTDGQDEPFTGQIDEVRIWNYPLTDNEILSGYNRVMTGSEPGLQAYYNFEDGLGSNILTDQSVNSNNGSLVNMDPSTDWITSGAEVSTISITNNITNTSDASGIYPVGDTDVIWTAIDANGNESSCTQTITVEDNEIPSAISQDVTLELDQNGIATLSAEMIDNGSTDNCEIQSKSITKTSFTCEDINNTLEPTYSISLNGNSDYVQIGSSSNLEVSAQLSIEAWVYPTGNQIGSQGGIIVNKEGEYEIARFPDGHLNYAISHTSDIWQWVDSGVEIPLDEWTHITFSYDGGSVKIFKNGVLASTIPTTGTIGDSQIFQNDLRIGGRQGYTQYFLGKIDEVRIWNKALTEIEVTDQFDKTLEGTESGLIGYWSFDEGSGTTTLDKTLNGNNGMLMNQANWSSPGAPGLVGDGESVVLKVIDKAGNEDTSIAVVRVLDNLPPNIIGKYMEVTLTESGNVSIVPNDVLESGSDNCGPIEYTISQDTFDAQDAINSPVSIQLTGTDSSGNETSVPVEITVIDPVPNAICKSISVNLNENGTVTITPEQIDNGSNSVVGIGNLSLDIDTFDCSNVGLQNTVVLTVESTLGAKASCEAIVTVEDNVVPVVVTQDKTVQLDASGVASIVPADIDNGSTDNCGISDYSLDINSFNCDDVDTPVTVTLTVTDVNGKSNSNTATVTVEDNVVPVVVTQDKTVQLNANGMAFIVPADIDNGSTDNCGIQSFSLDIDSFDCDDVGTPVTVTLTVTDVNGKSNSNTATVTVEDNVVPVVVTQDKTVQLDANGMASIVPADIDNGSTDNCGIQSFSLDIDSFDCDDVGTPVTVTLTVTDVNGKSNSNTATVTVEDNVVPVVVTQDKTVQLNANGMASIVPADIDNGSTDNCGISDYSLDINSFNCDDVDTPVTVTLTVTDVNGKSNSNTATVTVEDNVVPVVVTQDKTVQLNANGMASIVPADIDNGSTDNCGIQSFSLDIDSFDCDDVGTPVTVTLTVTDVNGKSNSNTATVTVEDNVVPVVVTQDKTVQLNANGMASIVPADIDNGSTDNCGIQSFSLDIDSFDCDDVGTPVTVTLTVTDVNGKSNSNTATVTVEDNVVPVVVTQDKTVQLDANGMASIVPADIDNGSTDNCGIQSFSLDIDSFDCDDVGTPVTVTLTVTDVNGKSNSNTATVTVEDNVVPVVVTQDKTVQLNANGMASIVPADIDNGSTDNCGIQSFSLDIDSFDCDDVGTPVTVTLTVTDVNGKSNSNTATVTVEDNVVPVVVTQDKTVQLNANGMASIVPADIDNGSTDNCGIQSFSLDIDSFDCDDVGTPVTVTLTVTDFNGKSNSNTATVTVEDNVVPVVVTQDKTVQLNANGMASIVPADIDNGSTDNCGIQSYSLDIDSFDCDDVGTPVTVTLTVTDVNGKSDSAPANVTVIDNIAPDITCISNQDRYVDPYQTYYTVLSAEFDATASDACGIASLTYSGGITHTSGTSMAGVQLDLGVNTMTWTATDENANSSDCSTSVTIKRRPTILTYNGDAQEQYSDNVSLSATLLDDVSGNVILGKTIKFTIGSQSTTAVTDANGVASTTLKLTQDPSNIYTVETEFVEDASYLGSTDSDAFDITQENAIIAYTGQSLQATPSSRDSEALVVLSANIQDITANTSYSLYDAYEGDIRNAKVKFDVLETGESSGWLSVTDLVDPADSKTGRVSYNWNAVLPGNNTSESFTVRILVDNGYYMAEDETVVTVYIPTGDFITGGGYLVPDSPSGQYASTPGLKTNFGFNVKYNKKGTKLKGHMNVIFRRLEADGVVHKYQIKSNAVQSLGVDVSDPEAQVATFITKSNLTDITDALNPVSLGGNLILKVDMTDRGEPGTDDSISFSLTDGNTGELLYSSNWSGIVSEEMNLSGGNLLVHSGFSVNDDSSTAEIKATTSLSTDQESSLDFSIAPNPSDSYFRVRIESEDQKNRIQLTVHSYLGSVVYETSGRPSDEFVFGNGFAAGTYVVRVLQNGQIVEKIVIKK